MSTADIRPARPADLMAQAAREEAAEAVRQVSGLASLYGMGLVETREARLCDCTDGRHPAPVRLHEPGSNDPWLWQTNVTRVERDRLYYTGDVHLQYQTVLTLTLPAVAS